MSASSLSQSRIVVLDDCVTSLRLVERVLQIHLGCQIACFTSPEAMWAGLGPIPPDLFVLDIRLGEQSGIEICRLLKTQESTRDVPIILFSDYGEPATRIESLRAGAIDYIDKPFYPEEFLQRVKGCLERFQYQRLIEEQVREQHALLRVLCHDLRNSVGSNLTLLHMLNDPADEEEREKWIALCLRSTQSALDLIAHVAEYRSLLNEENPFKLETIRVDEVCEESRHVFGPMAKAKGLRLELSDVPDFDVFSNRVVLVHNIINNLLSNAVKFSRPGNRIWIEASLVGDETHPECLIAIRDEGIGIPPAILESLLKKRVVCPRPGTSEEKGTGMGMTLVQLYVERCGGRISIESQVANPAQPEIKSGTCVRLFFAVAQREIESQTSSPELIAAGAGLPMVTA